MICATLVSGRGICSTNGGRVGRGLRVVLPADTFSFVVLPVSPGWCRGLLAVAKHASQPLPSTAHLYHRAVPQGADSPWLTN